MSQVDLDYTSIGGKKEKQVENTEEVKRLQDIMMGERKDQEAKRDLLDLEKENICGENRSSRQRGKTKGRDLDIVKERRVKVIIIAIITLLITNINIGILA